VRVVFATNILVSALVFPGGRGEAALQRIIDEHDDLVLSKPILDELLGVLPRKFSRDAEELARAAVVITTVATFVSPRRKLRVVKEDEPDNHVLECALTGHAHAIVTWDHAPFALQDFRGVRLLGLRDFIE
jgi:putative PIN family toxin of toxin-antitoxin system